MPAHRNCIHNQWFDLHLIIYDVIQYYCPAEQEEQLQNTRSYPEVEKVTNSFYDRLTHWYHHLPPCIREVQDGSPGVIVLQCVFFFLSLFFWLCL